MTLGKEIGIQQVSIKHQYHVTNACSQNDAGPILPTPLRAWFLYKEEVQCVAAVHPRPRCQEAYYEQAQASRDAGATALHRGGPPPVGTCQAAQTAV